MTASERITKTTASLARAMRDRERAIARAMRERDEAIIAFAREGGTTDRAAELAGMTDRRVRQILATAGASKPIGRPRRQATT